MRNKGHHTAKLVKEYRDKKGWSQKDVGHAIGLHAQFISNLERGLNGLPIRYFPKLSTELGISTEELRGAILRDYEDAINTEFKRIMPTDYGIYKF